MPDPTPNPFDAALAQLEQAQASEAAPQEKPLTVGDRVRDTVDSVNSGIGKAAHEGAETLFELARVPVRAGEWATNTMLGTDYYLSKEASDAFHEFSNQTAQADGSAYQSKTVAGGLTQGLTQFLTGFLAAGGTLKAANLMQKGSALARGVVEGAAADAAVFDPHEARLSDLVNTLAEKHPYLQNPITEFMAADPNDTEVEGRLKNALEGAVGGVVIERFIKALGATRRYLKGSKEPEARAKLEQAYEELTAASKDQPKAGFSDGEITGGTRDGVDSVVDQTQVPATKSTEGTQGMGLEKDPPITQGEAPTKPPSQGELVPDDKVNFSKDNPKSPDAPLLTKEDQERLLKGMKDNPDWLEAGFVNSNRAGFNFSKMDSPDGAKLAMEELAKVLPPPKRMTLGEIKKAADGLDIDIEDVINAGKVSTKELPQTIVAGKALLQSIARETSDLARKIGATDEAAAGPLKEELAKTLQRMTNLQTSLKTLQSDAARATTAGRIRTLDSFSPDELKAIAEAGGDVSKLLPIVKEQPLWARMFNAHNQVWINSLLSGPRTHLRNIISNTINSIVLPAERAIGGVMTKNGAMAREGADIALGLATAFKDSARMAWKASGFPEIAKAPSGSRWATVQSTGNSILDPGNTKLAAGNTRGPALSTDNFKSLEGTNLGHIMNGFGQLANIPSRFLTAEDEFFKQINYRAHVTAAALTAGRRKGLKGKELSNYVADRLHSAFDDNGAANLSKQDGIYHVKDEEFEAALEYARKASFTQKSPQGGIINWLENGTHNHPYLKLITPFVRTPTNILKAAAIRTPGLNMLSGKYRDALAGKLGERAKADAYGQMATGGALWTTALTLASEGMITGRGPSDPKERAALLDTGWQPYSIKVGDRYTSFEGFDPYSMFFGLAGDYADGAAHMDDKTRDNVVGQMLLAMAQNVTSKSYLTGITQVMGALSDPDKKGEAFLKSRLGSYVPGALNQVAGLVPGAQDPYMRETRSYMDTVLRRLPGFSESLPPRRNVFGEPITARQALGPDSISPFYSSTLTNDVAKRELARFAHAFGSPSQVIDGIDLTQQLNAKGQDFYDRWQEQLSTLKVGRYTLKERLENLVTSSQYAKWRENEADALSVGESPRTLKEVQAVISDYRERAKQKTLAEFPEVAQALHATRKARVRTKAGTDVPDQLQELINSFKPK